MSRECQSCGSRFCDGVACYLEEPEDERDNRPIEPIVERELRFTIELQKDAADAARERRAA